MRTQRLLRERLGVEVIAVDRYADAPAQQVAPRAPVIPMTDAAALRRFFQGLAGPIDHVLVTAGGPTCGPLL